ncbi:MAG: hypothetical protein AB2761_20215 [Candidatus Thiodiazotropha endolucinida]
MQEFDEIEEVKPLTKKQQLKAHIVDLKQQVEELNKQLDGQKSSTEYANQRARKVEDELQQLHIVFDSLGVTRKGKNDDGYSCSDVELTLASRTVKFVTKLIPGFSDGAAA